MNSRMDPPQVAVWSCKVAGEAFAFISNRLAAALPRAKTTEHLAGVFAFGLCNAVRRWLHSDTRLHEQARAGSVGEFLERGG